MNRTEVALPSQGLKTAGRFRSERSNESTGETSSESGKCPKDLKQNHGSWGEALVVVMYHPGIQGEAPLGRGPL